MSKGRVKFGNPETNLCLVRINDVEQKISKAEFMEKLNMLRQSNEVNEIYMNRKKGNSNFKVIFNDGDEMKISGVSKEDKFYNDLRKMSTVNVNLIAKTGVIAALATSGIVLMATPVGKEIVNNVETYIETTVEYQENRNEFINDLNLMQSYHSQLRTNMISENTYWDFYSLVSKYSDPEVIESLNISENDLATLERYKTDIQNYNLRGSYNDLENTIKIH